VLVIFGGSGDLAARKLLPALYNLALQRVLPAAFAVVGAARAQLTEEAFRAQLHDDVATFSRTRPLNEEVWASFAEGVHYVSTNDDAGYAALRTTLERLDRDLGTHGNRLFYLATPPAAYESILGKGQGAPPRRSRWIGAHRHREAVRPRSGERDRPQRGSPQGVP